MPRRRSGKIYVANESFVGNVDGADVQFIVDRTRVREGHPALEKWPHLFEEIDADYEVEAASAAPGEVRAA